MWRSVVNTHCGFQTAIFIACKDQRILIFLIFHWFTIPDLNLSTAFQAHHGVLLSPEALQAAAQLSQRCLERTSKNWEIGCDLMVGWCLIRCAKWGFRNRFIFRTWLWGLFQQHLLKSIYFPISLLVSPSWSIQGSLLMGSMFSVKPWGNRLEGHGSVNCRDINYKRCS